MQANVPILDEAYQVTYGATRGLLAAARSAVARSATARYVRGTIGKSRTVAQLRQAGIENGAQTNGLEGWRTRVQRQVSNRLSCFLSFGAGDGNRTHDIQLGKLSFYH
jgi:hypothetical protein